jgi:chorismate dehydratase
MPGRTFNSGCEILSHPELKVLPGMGVVARGKVWSVLLKCRKPIEQLQTVEIDPASRSSNTLTGILMHERFRLEVRFVPPGTETADAAVTIGDRALRLPPAPCGDIDLATAWHELTGLPFVFAMWACRRDSTKQEDLQAVAEKARQMGIDNLALLAERMSGQLELPLAKCRGYLTQVVSYEVGADESQAIEAFGRFIRELQPFIPRPVGLAEWAVMERRA